MILSGLSTAVRGLGRGLFLGARSGNPWVWSLPVSCSESLHKVCSVWSLGRGDGLWGWGWDRHELGSVALSPWSPVGPAKAAQDSLPQYSKKWHFFHLPIVFQPPPRAGLRRIFWRIQHPAAGCSGSWLPAGNGNAQQFPVEALQGWRNPPSTSVPTSDLRTTCFLPSEVQPALSWAPGLAVTLSSSPRVRHNLSASVSLSAKFR